MQEVEVTPDAVRIGACVTHAALAAAVDGLLNLHVRARAAPPRILALLLGREGPAALQHIASAWRDNPLLRP